MPEGPGGPGGPGGPLAIPLSENDNENSLIDSLSPGTTSRVTVFCACASVLTVHDIEDIHGYLLYPEIA